MEQRRFCRMPAENLVLVFCETAGSSALSWSQCWLFSCSLDPSFSSLMSPWSANTLQRLKPPSFTWGEQRCFCHCSERSSLVWGAGACWGKTPNFSTLILVLQELSQLEAVCCASPTVAICNGRMNLFYKAGQSDGIPGAKGLSIPQHFRGSSSLLSAVEELSSGLLAWQCLAKLSFIGTF